MTNSYDIFEGLDVSQNFLWCYIRIIIQIQEFIYRIVYQSGTEAIVIFCVNLHK